MPHRVVQLRRTGQTNSTRRHLLFPLALNAIPSHRLDRCPLLKSVTDHRLMGPRNQVWSDYHRLLSAYT